MRKELLTKLKLENEACEWWKQGQMTQEEYMDTVQGGQVGMRKSKAHV